MTGVSGDGKWFVAKEIGPAHKRARSPNVPYRQEVSFPGSPIR